MKRFKDKAKWKETLYRREPAASPGDGVKGDVQHVDSPVEQKNKVHNKDALLAQKEPGPGMVKCHDCGHYFPKAEVKQITRRVSIVDFSVRSSGDGHSNNPGSEMVLNYCVPCAIARRLLQRVSISEETVLSSMPEKSYVKISYIIKALGLSDIREARYLENTLKALVGEGKVEIEIQDGKSYYKKRE